MAGHAKALDAIAPTLPAMTKGSPAPSGTEFSLGTVNWPIPRTTKLRT